MRYRKLTDTNDYSFGQGLGNFLINTPAAVAQAVLTRLRLMQGEWFLNLEEGTPYATQILGKNTKSIYDAAIREVITGTQGVVQITAYSSNLNETTRALKIECTIATIYGETTISTDFIPVRTNT